MNIRKRDEQGTIKIAVVESYGRNNEDAIRPFNLMTSQHEHWNDHPGNVIKVIRDYVPNAEIHLVEKSVRGYEYIVANDIAIVNLSMAGTGHSTYDHILADTDIMLVCAAGNNGQMGESWNAQQDHWLSVGAVDQELNPKYYSSYGENVVDTVAITPYIDGVLKQGTSFTSPTVVGLLAQWFIWYEKMTGVYPSRHEAHDFVERNSHDIWEDGRDLRTGHGLFRLPKVFKKSVVVVREGYRVASVINYVEGEDPLIEKEDLLSDAKIYDGRLNVPLRGAANCFRRKTLWDPDKHQATFI